MQEADDKLESIRKLYQTKGFTLQPLVMEISHTQQYVVVLDNHRWIYKNVVKAMDVAFKLIQVRLDVSGMFCYGLQYFNKLQVLKTTPV